jgi:prepilin-type N-terminal cleavage/methylation domain-containing protein
MKLLNLDRSKDLRQGGASVHGPAPSRRGQPGRARSAGFTLVEVMVVMLVMSGLLVSISQVLNSARSSRDLIYNIQETQLTGPAILDLIERDLRGLFLFLRLPEDALSVRDRVISGFDADSIHFVTSTNARLVTEGRDRKVRSDVCEVGYVLRPSPEAPNDFLEIWRRESYGVDELPFEGGRYSFLHDRIKGFDIQLFEGIGDDSEPIDSWEKGTHEKPLPRRIEITLTIELAPRLVREQLTVAPTDMRTLEYRRVIPIPSGLALAINLQPIPRPPDIAKPVPGQAPGSALGAGGPGGPGGPPGAGLGPGNPAQGGGIDFPGLGGDAGGGSPQIPGNLLQGLPPLGGG